jgi:hypothetical protein
MCGDIPQLPQTLSWFSAQLRTEIILAYGADVKQRRVTPIMRLTKPIPSTNDSLQGTQDPPTAASTNFIHVLLVKQGLEQRVLLFSQTPRATLRPSG